MPAFGKGTVNVGERQRGRLRGASVIDCAPERGAIIAAINHLYSTDFKAVLLNMSNPYGSAGAAKRVDEVLSKVSLNGILKKDFFDLPGA